MKIISISGLDGSGKSTQIELLRNYLEKQGKKVFYFHAVQFSIANRKNNIKKEANGVTEASWLKIQLRKVALLFDLFRFKDLIGKLEKEKFDYILSDRYFYDNVINIAYLSKKTVFLNLPIKKPDFAFYLDIAVEKIMQRERVPDQGLEYLKEKKKLLDIFSEKYKLIKIDGNQSKEEILNNIKSQIQMTNAK